MGKRFDIIDTMLRNVIPFAKQRNVVRKESPAEKMIGQLVKFIEEKTGGEMVYDAARFPFMRPELADLFELAEKLRSTHVLKRYGPMYRPPDEPPLRMWNGRYRDGNESIAGGSAVEDDRAALSATLAESIERHIWFEQTDYFADERYATVSEIQQFGEALVPSRFSSFSEATRRAHKQLELRDVPYTWIRGIRLTDDAPVFVPAQIVSAALRTSAAKPAEPVIAYPITTGLATWPTRDGALLRGILENVERDAFMITWLNRLSATRFDVDELCKQRPSLATLVARCRRYRLEPYFVRLVTDAPTYVVGAVLEDTTGNAPYFAHGLRAGADPASLAEKAIIEALRGRNIARMYLQRKKPDDPLTDALEVGHFKRLLYWAESDHHKELAFFHAGAVRAQDEEWRNEPDDTHMARLLKWIDARGYGCVSVPLTRSRANCSPWHIEMVVIPEMQRMHFNERHPYVGGARITEVPRALGYTPREEPFLDHPHPFS